MICFSIHPASFLPEAVTRKPTFFSQDLIQGTSLNGAPAFFVTQYAPAQALNISTRMRVETGNNVLIGGFIITGSAPKNVAVRGIGPSLTQFGVPDALADPTLELRDNGGGLVRGNDNWQDDPSQASQLYRSGSCPPESQPNRASSLRFRPQPTPPSSREKMEEPELAWWKSTTPIPGANSQLANISTRGFVLTGTNVMIGGFILGGANNTHVVVRGIGPSLAQFGLSPVWRIQLSSCATVTARFWSRTITGRTTLFRLLS